MFKNKGGTKSGPGIGSRPTFKSSSNTSEIDKVQCDKSTISFKSWKTFSSTTLGVVKTDEKCSTNKLAVSKWFTEHLFPKRITVGKLSFLNFFINFQNERGLEDK